MESNKKDNRTDDDRTTFRNAVLLLSYAEKEVKLNCYISQTKDP